MSHPIVHIEFSTHDRHDSARFYHEVFGWQTQDIPEMSYVTFDPGDGPGGGFNPVKEDFPAGTVAVYIYAEDIEAALARVEAHGGKTLVPKSEITGMGHFAFFLDPTGNMIGLVDIGPPERD